MNSGPLSPTANPEGDVFTGARKVTLTALFRSETDAEHAVKELLDEGFPRDAIRLMPGFERDVPGDPMPDATSVDPAKGIGFSATLGELFRSENARGVETDGVSRSGFLVSVQTTEINHDRALTILGREGTIDTDDSEMA